MKPQLIFYPMTFALWIVLASYVPHTKMGEVGFPDILRALVFTSVCTLAIWFLLGMVLKNWKLGALLTSVMTGLLFSYQFQVEHFGNMIFVGDQEFGMFIPVSIWIIACLMVYYLKNSLDQATKILNITGWCLLGVELGSLLAIQLMSLQVSTADSHAAVHDRRLLLLESQLSKHNPKKESENIIYPHIYYIILDGYGRDDVLREQYNYDNTPFIQALTEDGFYVARKSRSNYAQTVLSLSSSLNFQYLDRLSVKIETDSNNRDPLRELIRENRLMVFLKKQGYHTVAFGSGISFTELREADNYIIPDRSLTEWESFFLMQTPIPAAMETLYGHSLYDVHKTRIVSIANSLPKIIEDDHPQFVFAHFVAPHPPFVLGRQDNQWQRDHTFSFRDGSEYRYHYNVSAEEYRVRYIEQLHALNEYITTAIQGILSEAKRPTIIILQADHGPGADLDWRDPSHTSFKERMSILNAYYIPDGKEIGLYPEITPVNTFRLILNYYFDEQFPLLDDENYFSTMDRPYEFLRVTDQIEKETSGTSSSTKGKRTPHSPS